MVEAQPKAAQAMVQSLFAGVAKGRVADVVDQRQCLGQLRIQPQGAGERAGDLSHFQRMGEAAAEVVRRGVRGQAGQDLGFAGQAAKSACMENTRAVPGKGGAIGMGRLGVRAARQFAALIPSYGYPWGQCGSRFCRLLAHRGAIKDFTSGYTAERDRSAKERHMRVVNHHRVDLKML